MAEDYIIKFILTKFQCKYHLFLVKIFESS